MQPVCHPSLYQCSLLVYQRPGVHILANVAPYWFIKGLVYTSCILDSVHETSIYHGLSKNLSAVSATAALPRLTNVCVIFSRGECYNVDGGSG